MAPRLRPPSRRRACRACRACRTPALSRSTQCRGFPRRFPPASVLDREFVDGLSAAHEDRAIEPPRRLCAWRAPCAPRRVNTRAYLQLTCNRPRPGPGQPISLTPSRARSRTSIVASTGDSVSAFAIRRKDDAEMAWPANAAPTVCGLSRAARASSLADRPRRAISSLSRAASTSKLIEAHPHEPGILATLGRRLIPALFGGPSLDLMPRDYPALLSVPKVARSVNAS